MNPSDRSELNRLSALQIRISKSFGLSVGQQRSEYNRLEALKKRIVAEFTKRIKSQNKSSDEMFLTQDDNFLSKIEDNHLITENSLWESFDFGQANLTGPGYLSGLDNNTELAALSGNSDKRLGAVDEFGDEMEFGTVIELSDEIELGSMAEYYNEGDLGVVAESCDEMELGAIDESCDERDLQAEDGLCNENDLGADCFCDEIDFAALQKFCDEVELGAVDECCDEKISGAAESSDNAKLKLIKTGMQGVLENGGLTGLVAFTELTNLPELNVFAICEKNLTKKLSR